MANCIDKIIERYPELSKVEARNMKEALDELDTRLANDTAYLNSMKKEFYNEVEQAALDRQMSEVTHVITLKKNLEHVLQPAFRGKADKGAESLVIFTPFSAKNQTRNATDIATVFRAKHENMLEQVFDIDGIANQINDPAFARNVYKDFYDRYWGRATPNKYGSSVTKAVDGIIKVNKSMIADMRASGSTIKFNESHLVSQGWSPELVLANKESFIDEMMARIDLNASFGPTGGTVKAARAHLASFADRMGKMDLEKSGARFSFTGGKKTIIFKDGDGAHEMMVKYGYADLGHGLKSGINRLSKKQGLTAVFGNNADKGITDLKSYVEDIMSQKQNLRNFDDGIDLLRGTGNTYNNPNSVTSKALVSTVKGAKVITTLRYLGASAPKVLMDMPLAVMTNVSQGTSIPKATSRVLVNALEGVVKGKEARKEMARQMIMHLENHKMAMYSELDGGPDMWSKVGTKFYGLSGISYVGEIMQTASAKTTMQNFTDIISKGPKGSRLKLQNLQRGGFSGAEATLMRDMYKASGDEILSPATILNSKLGTKESRHELSNKLATHYLQLTNEGITTTDSRLQVWSSKQKPIDDIDRLARSVFSTFLTSITKETVNMLKAARAISPQGTVRSKKGISAVAVASVTFALMDYVTDEMKTYFNGTWDDKKEPTGEEFRKHMIDSGSWGLLINAMVNMVNGRQPIGTPAPLSIAKDIKDNVVNEFNIATGDKKAMAKSRKSTVLERQLEFMLEMSPVEKFWAKGLLIKAYDSIIEDTGKRSSARKTRRTNNRRR